MQRNGSRSAPWIPLGSCSLRGSTWWCLWCLFPSWAGKGDNPPRRLNGKYHVRSQCCSQLCGEELSQCFLSCFFPGSGRKLLSGIWSLAPHIVLALAPMAGQVKDGPACQEMWQPYHKVNPLYMAFFCKAGRAGPVQFFHNTGRKIQTML